MQVNACIHVRTPLHETTHTHTHSAITGFSLSCCCGSRSWALRPWAMDAMDPWAISGEEDDGEPPPLVYSSDDEGEDPWGISDDDVNNEADGPVARGPRVRGKGRGRPRGRGSALAGRARRGRGKGWRKGLAGRHDQRKCGVVPAVNAEEPQARASTIAFLPPECYPVIGHAVLAQVSADDDVDIGELAQKTVAAVFNSKSALFSAKTAVAAQLQITIPQFTQRLLLIAAGLYFGARVWVGQILQRILSWHEENPSGKLLASCTYIEYDETPLRCRSDVESAKDQRALVDTATAPLSEEQLPRKEQEPVVSKLFQAELWISCLVQPVSDLPHMVIHSIHVPCPVLLGDRGTAEVVRAVVSEMLEVPTLDKVAAADGVAHFALSTSDRASANLRAEDALYFDRPGVLKLHLPCGAHIVSTSTARAFGCTAGDISGIIALSIVLRGAAGSANRFRKCIKDVLLGVVVSPLPAPGAYAAHSAAIIDLCLQSGGGKTVGYALRRRFLLRTLVNDDWSTDDIIYFAGSEEGAAAFQKEEWATKVANLLLPVAPSVQNSGTTRWVNSVEPLKAYCLAANCHNLLTRAGRAFFDIKNDRNNDGTDPWGISDDDDDDHGKSKAKNSSKSVAVVSDPTEVGEKVGVSAERDAVEEFNVKQRGSATRLISSNPQHRLVVETIVFGSLCTRCLQSIEKFAGNFFDLVQEAAHHMASSFGCRVLAAHQGSIHEAVPGIVRSLLFSNDPWKALHPGARTWGHAGLGFVCISVFLCSMQQLLWSFWATYPYRPLVVEL